MSTNLSFHFGGGSAINAFIKITENAMGKAATTSASASTMRLLSPKMKRNERTTLQK